MAEFKHILVPTDFGEASGRALELALVFASRFGSSVTLLHSYVIQVASYGYAAGFVWPLEDLREAAQKELRGVIDEARKSYSDVDGALVYGEPWHEIVETTKLGGVDLVVMGTHGRHGLSRVLLGSVAERVVRLAPVPVLTVSYRGDAEGAGFRRGESPSRDR